jgi:adenylosuccinate synthase
LKKLLTERYGVNHEEYDFGWLDLNPVRHAHMIMHISSLYLTGLDALDKVEDIKICKRYKIMQPSEKEGEPQKEIEVEGIHPTIINDLETL